MTAKEMIAEKLQFLDVCLHTDDVEYTVRCPYCGDSKNPNHAHLGIFISMDDDTPMMWNCLRCGEGGLLTEQLMVDLGLSLNKEEFNVLKDYDRVNKKLANSRQTIVRTSRYRVPPDVTDKRSLYKLQYVIDRLGVPIRPVPNKIILSIKDFLAFNEIPGIPGVVPWKLEMIEKNYVGFLSSNNNCITLRRTTDNYKLLRYDKILINPYMDDNGSFYSIPSKLNLMYHEPLHVHIAEGTFDILSIKHNLYPEDDGKLRIFYASCGFSYLSILKHLIRSGICTNLILHIYADRDKTDSKHIQILRRTPLSIFIEHAYIHRNACPGEKDYGVRLENIQDKARQLW